MKQVRGRTLLCAALVVAVSPALAPVVAHAQTAPAPELLRSSGEASDAPRPVAVLERTRSEYDPVGIPAGSFIFYPSSIGSVTFDDNVYATQTNKVSDVVFQDQSVIRAAGDYGPTQIGGYAGFVSRVYAKRSSLDSVAPTYHKSG